MPKRINPSKAKIHRSYYVSEAAEVLSVHKNTVRDWIKSGLPVCDNQYPTLILGRNLRDFLKAKQQRQKRPCKVNEIYCVRCRTPRRPMGDMVDYVPETATRGKLTALCSRCELVINRFSTLDKAVALRAFFEVSIRGTNNT